MNRFLIFCSVGIGFILFCIVAGIICAGGRGGKEPAASAPQKEKREKEFARIEKQMARLALRVNRLKLADRIKNPQLKWTKKGPSEILKSSAEEHLETYLKQQGIKIGEDMENGRICFTASVLFPEPHSAAVTMAELDAFMLCLDRLSSCMRTSIEKDRSFTGLKWGNFVFKGEKELIVSITEGSRSRTVTSRFTLTQNVRPADRQKVLTFPGTPLMRITQRAELFASWSVLIKLHTMNVSKVIWNITPALSNWNTPPYHGMKRREQASSRLLWC